MKADYINPFIESVHEIFSTMLGCNLERGDVALSKSGGGTRDLTALIGLSGPARGMVALSFPVRTALSVVGKMIGTEIRIVDDTVSDGVAELVNMVAGAAKAKFCRGDGIPIDLSLPTVVRGNNYSVDYPTQTTWLEIPFKCDLGVFDLRVTFEMDASRNGGA